MMPFSDIGLSSISRVFDVNVALCTTSAAWRLAWSPCWGGDVGGHRMGLGSNLKNPSTTVHAE